MCQIKTFLFTSYIKLWVKLCFGKTLISFLEKKYLFCNAICIKFLIIGSFKFILCNLQLKFYEMYAF